MGNPLTGKTRGTARETDSGDPRAGSLLFMLMLLMATLAIFGTTAYLTSRFDIQITRSHITTTRALFEADAGVRHVVERLKEDLDSGALRLDEAFETVNYPAPAGLSFDSVSTLTRLADNISYSFDVTGRNLDSEITLQAVVTQDQALDLGLFADLTLDFGPTAKVYSYYSDDVSVPTSFDNAGTAKIGTNGQLLSDEDTVDGTIYLGESEDGSPAEYDDEDDGDQTAEIVRLDRMDPDPLGAVGGELADEFTRVAGDNDNGLAVGGTTDAGQLILTGDVTLPSGEYYVSEIDIGNHSTLAINAADGPVIIYLTGDAFIAPRADLIVNPSVPSHFQIYCKGPSNIEFKPHTDFTGFIYAPYADVRIMPNGNLYGAMWAAEIEIKPNGDFFMDLSLFDALFSRDLTLYSWKQLQ